MFQSIKQGTDGEISKLDERINSKNLLERQQGCYSSLLEKLWRSGTVLYVFCVCYFFEQRFLKELTLSEAFFSEIVRLMHIYRETDVQVIFHQNLSSVFIRIIHLRDFL